MKKRILKQKKKIIVYKKRKGAGKALLAAAAICLFLGAAGVAYGEEKESGQAPKVVITDIYHRHIGNTNVKEGCYSVPISHVHQGDTKTGGDCYQTPVYHSHTGSADLGGGCYSIVIDHVHQGNETQGGACYVPAETHTHTNACYIAGDCMVYYTAGEIIETMQDNCFQHKETVFVKSRGTEVHDSCGMGTVEAERIYCQSCGFISPTVHAYQNKVCGLKEGEVTAYRRNCNKIVERYETGCGKAEKEIESYALSCSKSIEGYEIGCGLQESVPCGRLIVTNETADSEETATLSVKIEDLTDGKLKVSSDPYLWQDENGNQVGSGQRIQVDKNGLYYVTVKLENKDVDEKGLCSKILVDNLYKAQPAADPSPTASPTASPSDAPMDQPTPQPDTPETPSSKVDDAKEDEGTENEGTENEKKVQEEKKKTEEPSDRGEEIKHGAGKSFPDKKEIEPSPSPTPVKPIWKETKEVTLPEKDAPGEMQYQVSQKKNEKGFFSPEAVKVITITAGMAVLLLGAFLLALYLRHSVKVYNDDGQGRMIYLGRCMVREEEETFAVTITEGMVEKACTNRYCIKPGLFCLGRKEGEELIVHKESKSVAVYLSREMIVML